jgi:hypothetical protein
MSSLNGSSGIDDAKNPVGAARMNANDITEHRSSLTNSKGQRDFAFPIEEAMGQIIPLAKPKSMFGRTPTRKVMRRAMSVARLNDSQ